MTAKERGTMQHEQQSEFQTVFSGRDIWAVDEPETERDSAIGIAFACILGGALWAFGYWALCAWLGGAK